MVYTYLLQSIKNGGFYTGISKNVLQRLKLHNTGRVKRSAKNRPYKLIYYKEHATYIQARSHEIWLKKKNILYKKSIGVAQLAPPNLGGVK